MKSVVVRVLVASCVLAAPTTTTGQIVALSPTAKADVTIGDEKFVFTHGGCTITNDAFGIGLGDMTKGEHFELNIPNGVRSTAPEAVKPAKDGTYTSASVYVMKGAAGSDPISYRAGGRTAREADLTVTLKNNRRAGEFSGRTDGSPRKPIKGTFSC